MSRPQAEVRIGPYRLVERLGAGGMGVVYKALADADDGASRPVVVKRVLPAFCTDPGFVRMLVREARLGALLKHPGIVQVLELGESHGEYYLAMEYIDGFNLTSVLRAAERRQRPMPCGVAVQVVSEVLAALAYAHASRDDAGTLVEIVHRDVSPSNIMLTRGGSVKLVDFGIAKAVNHATGDVTASGSVKGKLGYLAPEQLRRQHIDRRTDIYALGVVFHELLTMKRLFGGRDYLDVMRWLMESTEVPPPSSLCAAVPPAVDRIVLKMLARDPVDRFGSCEEILAALAPVRRMLAADASQVRAYLQELDPIDDRLEPTASMPAPRPSSTTSSSRPTVSGRGRRGARPRRLYRAALAVGALVLIGSGVATGMMLARRAVPAALSAPRPNVPPTPRPPPPTAETAPSASAPAPASAPERAPRRRHNRAGAPQWPTPLGPTFQEDDIKDPFAR